MIVNLSAVVLLVKPWLWFLAQNHLGLTKADFHEPSLDRFSTRKSLC